jgi:hypothetical protein
MVFANGTFFFGSTYRSLHIRIREGMSRRRRADDYRFKSATLCKMPNRWKGAVRKFISIGNPKHRILEVRLHSFTRCTFHVILFKKLFSKYWRGP